MAPEIWTANDIAAWLKYSRRHVAERLIFERGFPAPIRDGKGVHRRWLKDDIIEWATKLKRAA